MNLFIQDSSVFQKKAIPMHQNACKVHRTLAKNAETLSALENLGNVWHQLVLGQILLGAELS